MSEKNIPDTERASDLWYSIQEDAESKHESRSQLIAFLKLEARIAKKLDPELREAINPSSIPVAYDDRTGNNIAYTLLAPLSSCEWINAQDEPALDRIFRIVAILVSHPQAEECWQELFNLTDKLE